MIRQRTSTSKEAKPTQSLIDLREQLIRGGPSALKPKEKLRLLWNAETVFSLHQELWSRPESQIHPSWLQLQSETWKNTLLRTYLGQPHDTSKL